MLRWAILRQRRPILSDSDSDSFRSLEGVLHGESDRIIGDLSGLLQ